MVNKNNKAFKWIDRRFDIINVCVALCLTIFGYSLGVLEDQMVDISLIFTVITSLCGLIIAKQALYTWRNQFKYQEQYKSLIQADIDFNKYCIFGNDERVISHKRINKAEISDDAYTKDEMPDDAYLKEKNEIYNNYERSWDELSIHCEDFIRDNAKLSPDNLGKIYLTTSPKSKGVDYDKLHEDTIRDGRLTFQTYRKELK